MSGDGVSTDHSHLLLDGSPPIRSTQSVVHLARARGQRRGRDDRQVDVG